MLYDSYLFSIPIICLFFILIATMICDKQDEDSKK